jgi:hypothetical protein
MIEIQNKDSQENRRFGTTDFADCMDFMIPHGQKPIRPEIHIHLGGIIKVDDLIRKIKELIDIGN